MVRVAVLGAGYWGRIVLKTLLRLDGLTVTRVASENPETAALLPAGCSVEADWRAVATAPDVDGVIVCTPPHLHAVMGMTALAAGKALFIEKPLTLDFAEAQALRDLAHSEDAFVMVDHIHLYSPAWLALKARLADIGRLQHLEGVAGRSWTGNSADAPVLWEWGAHDVAMTLDLVRADPSHCVATVYAGPEPLQERVSLDLAFGETRAAIDVCNHLPSPARRFTVQGEAGTLVYDDKAPEKLLHDGRPVPVAATLPLDRALLAFVRGIADGATDRADLELGVAVVATLERCQSQLS